MVCHGRVRRGAGCALPAPPAARAHVWRKCAGGSRARAPMPARTPSAAAGEPPSPSERAPATCGERALSFGVAGVHRAVCSHARRDGRHAPDRRSATLESSTRSPARGAPMSAFPCSPSFQLRRAFVVGQLHRRTRSIFAPGLMSSREGHKTVNNRQKLGSMPLKYVTRSLF